ncbi:uncharacterized protein LOC110863264 isoform X1 [Folsomia candida]|nr:uncharacterized protein LOC110863264 isoform X1 [Folsomia candida]XP_035702808.1 uncharacterized protein LOC110863264 isoform X1 [Folsomia candida]
MMARTGTKRKISESSQSSKNEGTTSVSSNKNAGSSRADNNTGIAERGQTAGGTETTENSTKTNSGPDHTDPAETNDEGEFYVESIRDMKIENGKRYFLVKWSGYDEKDNSWEPEENMQGSQKLISEYTSRLKQLNSQKEQAAKKKQNSIEIVAKKPKLEYVATVDLTDVQSSTKKASSTVVSRTNVVAKLKPQIQVLGSLGQNIKLLSFQNNDLVKSVQQTGNKQNARHLQPLRRNNITVIPSPSTPLLMQPKNQPTSAVISKQQNDNFSEPQMLSLVYNFLLWINNNFQLLQFNIENSQDQLHKLVVTEDIKGLHPLILYGIIQAEDKNRYCFVQFEEHNYIDCVTPVNLCRRIPGIDGFIKNQIDIARNMK